MIVFEVCVNFAFKQLFDAVIAVRTQRLLKTGKTAIISPHPLILTQINADEVETATSINFLPPLTLSAWTTDVPG